jgi:uncharacterized protein YdhG (YjbR/CyaY superfamily)
MDLAPDVLRYIEQARPGHRAALLALAQTIRAAVPTAPAAIRRGVPAFHHRRKPLVSFGDAQHHVALYVMYGGVLKAFAQRLAGYATSNTVVRFAPDKPIPTRLVIELVRARADEIDRALG